MKTVILIALLRTINEGGAIQRDFPDTAACLEFGSRLEQQFEAIPLPNDHRPSVIWTCVESGK